MLYTVYRRARAQKDARTVRIVSKSATVHDPGGVVFPGRRFVAEVERAGCAVHAVTLGAGLFGLCPKPTELAFLGGSTPGWSRESYPDAIADGALPPHCQCHLASNHVENVIRVEMRDQRHARS